MHQYHIQRLVNAVTHTWDTKEFHGYLFEPYNKTTMRSGFLVSKTVEGNKWSDAQKLFLEELEPILDGIAIVTQSMFKHGPSSSHIIYRLDENPDRVFLAWLAKHENPVGMDFDLKSWDDIEKLIATDQPNFISMLRESHTGYTPRQRFALMLLAVESFAGSKKASRKCECGREHYFSVLDRSKSELLLGKPLSDRIFASGGARHKFFHGNRMSEAEIGDLVKEMYDKIVFEYLIPTYGLQSIEKIKDPPRAWRIGVFYSFMKSLSGEPKLLDVIENRNDARKFEVVGSQENY